MKILVTGGAGYIGSHTLIELLRADHELYIVDNLSNSSEESLRRVKKITNKDFQFSPLDIRDFDDLNRVFIDFQPEAVIHFAGLKAVGESVEKPLLYYDNNVNGSIQLLAAMDENHCNKLVFSSSCTVYGTPEYLPIDENHPLNPVNPYGYSKYMTENILKDWAKNEKKACALRYFNPIGAHESGYIGEDPYGIPNNLMPYISQVAVGKRDCLKIFGDDYETRDGTGERDYIHVTDLAQAHLRSIERIDELSNFEVLNIGTGQGTTVKELVDAFNKELGREIPNRVVERRPGDVDSTIASPKKANLKINWHSKLSLDEAVSSSWNWQKNNPNGYK